MELQAIKVDTWWKFGANMWQKTWKNVCQTQSK